MKMNGTSTAKKYNYPKEVRLIAKEKVDAVGIQSQFKDMEALQDELRKLQKAKRNEIENRKSLRETLQDYEHQRIKLEAQVLHSISYRYSKKKMIYLLSPDPLNVKTS
jgi:hypothetical protein